MEEFNALYYILCILGLLLGRIRRSFLALCIISILCVVSAGEMMDICWFKVPIYFIIFNKVLQIGQVYAILEKTGKLTRVDEHALLYFMAMYGAIFVLLLLS